MFNKVLMLAAIMVALSTSGSAQSVSKYPKSPFGSRELMVKVCIDQNTCKEMPSKDYYPELTNLMAAHHIAYRVAAEGKATREAIEAQSTLIERLTTTLDETYNLRLDNIEQTLLARLELLASKVEASDKAKCQLKEEILLEVSQAFNKDTDHEPRGC